MNFKIFLEDYHDVFAVFVACKLPNGKFAATTRASDKKNHDDGVKCGLPGGKIDDRESLVDAAIRESKEEGWILRIDDEIPFHIQDVQGKKCAWVKGTALKKLKDYKEKYRGILPIEVDRKELVGFGNDNALKAYDEKYS
jgi:8-oxo-dGTP pyrophosphatase MutT (NUDIX family)